MLRMPSVPAEGAAEADGAGAVGAADAGSEAEGAEA